MSMRPEAELLFCCARSTLDPATADRVQTLIQCDINWLYLLSMARRNKVLPLLHRHLHAIDFEGAPKAIADWTTGYVQNNTQRSEALSEELLSLLALLASHGIPAVPYKGVVLSAFAYGNPAIRECGDIDIVVRRQDVLKTKEAMISYGYRPVSQLTPQQEQAHLEHECEYNFQRDDGQHFRVEIHWQFASNSYNFPFDMESIWPRLRPLRLHDREVSTFGLEDLLLALCFHGTKHYWRRLHWLCDFSETIQLYGDDVDWDEVLLQAGKLRIRRALFIALYLARNLLGARIPERVEEQMQSDILAESLAARLAQQFVTESEYSWMDDLVLIFEAREHIVDQVSSYWVPIVTKKYAEALYDPSVRKWRIPPTLYWTLFARCLFSRYVSDSRYILLLRSKKPFLAKSRTTNHIGSSGIAG